MLKFFQVTIRNITLDKRDNFEILKTFSHNINTFFKKAIEIEFYCKNQTLSDVIYKIVIFYKDQQS